MKPPLRPSDYYTQVRHELLPLLEPVKNSSILDVGCGAGAMGEWLRTLGCQSVIGIEPIDVQGEKAALHYDKVFLCPVEEADLTPYYGTFDTILCADVLEHLVDPWNVLACLLPCLKKGGSLVASIPNLRNGKIVGALLAGKFDYQSAGILDKSHLRFFTFQSVVELFHESGYQLETIGPVFTVNADTLLPQWKATGLPQKLEEICRILTGNDTPFTHEDLLDLFTHQFLVKAKAR